MGADRVLLLTGVPGIGKTTVIRQVADRLKGRNLGGFYTEEIREDGGCRWKDQRKAKARRGSLRTSGKALFHYWRL